MKNRFFILTLFCFLVAACSSKDLLKWNKRADDFNDPDISLQNTPKQPDVINFPVNPFANNSQMAQNRVGAAGYIPTYKPKKIAGTSSDTFPRDFYKKNGKHYAPVSNVGFKPTTTAYYTNNRAPVNQAMAPAQQQAIYNPSNANYSINHFSKPKTYWSLGANRVQRVASKINKIKDRKKRQFVSGIGKEIASVNENIQRDRYELQKLIYKISSGKYLGKSENNWLYNLASKYEVKNFNPNNRKHINEIYSRVDIVPESLAIAQAAIESGWGKSRFAREGNNYFGHWCFSKGCGLVPKKRSKGKSHEVRVFGSPRESVEAYIHNLNTHRAYSSFRKARQNLGVRMTGMELANYLSKYSEKGSKYGRMVGSIIASNNLE